MIEYVYRRYGIITREFYADDKIEDCLERAMADIEWNSSYPIDISKDGILIYEHKDILQEWSKHYNRKDSENEKLGK